MNDLFQQGVAAYKAGKRDEARKFFIILVKQTPNDERTWEKMHDVSNNDQERIHCLKQILRINPNNEKAKNLLDTILTSDFPFGTSQENETHTQKQIAFIASKENHGVVQQKSISREVKKYAYKFIRNILNIIDGINDSNAPALVWYILIMSVVYACAILAEWVK